MEGFLGCEAARAKRARRLCRKVVFANAQGMGKRFLRLTGLWPEGS